MSANAYELLSLTMRYIFAALLILIVLRAARGALVDARRSTRLRRLSPMTGLSGELILLDPLPKAPRGMRFPVIREGAIGSSRRADIRIRDKSVRSRHALFQLTDTGLHIRAHAAARFRDALGNPARDLTLLDGDSFYLGGAHLLLVLSVPDLPRRPTRASYDPIDDDDDDPFTPSYSDPVSPIFETRDPYDDEPLYAKPRGERIRRQDPVSHRVNIDPAMQQPESRRKSERVFLDDDDLFNIDDKN